MRSLLALVPLAIVAACAQTPAQTARAEQARQATNDALAARLAGLVPGRRDSCIPITLVSAGTQLKAYGPTLLYIVGRDVVYRNDTTGGCENVARGDTLVSVQPQGRACQGDIARTVDPTSHFTSGSCALGEFVRYERPK